MGDLVRFESPLSDDMDRYKAHHGLIVQMSRTGHATESAQVLFNDGETWWLDTQSLSVVSESR